MSQSNQQTPNNVDNIDVPFSRLTLIFVIVITIQVIFGIIVYLFFNNWDDRSKFGDMFGAVDTLFSGFAFAGVIYAILLQRRDLELQRRELEMTREELSRSAEAQEKSELALAEQAKALNLSAKLNALNLIPAIVCQFYTDQKKVHLNIDNVGNSLAFDIDILCVGSYLKEITDPIKFISSYVKDNCPYLSRFTEPEEDHFGVYDHITYSVVPARRQISTWLDFPIVPENIHLLLQYRDVQGNNYHRVFFFYNSSRDKQIKVYQNAGMHPTIPTISPRIEFEGFNLELKAEDDSEIPEYVNSDFTSIWDYAIPSGYTKSTSLIVEERGKWNDI